VLHGVSYIFPFPVRLALVAMHSEDIPALVQATCRPEAVICVLCLPSSHSVTPYQHTTLYYIK
jgi:hypothetical protein